MKNPLRLLLLLLALLSAGPVGAAPLNVVASFSILGDMVREVGGEQVALATLIGPGVDPHAFEPAPRHAKALSHADVLVINGLDFEPWLPRLRQAAGFAGTEVVASRGVQALPGDPHAWLDLAQGSVYVANIAQALADADPAHAPDYRARAQALQARLQERDRALKTAFSGTPRAGRRVGVLHDAYGYFGRAYGVEFLALAGRSSEAEPSAAGLARMIDLVRHEQVRALFPEAQGDVRIMEQIARETGATIGGALYSDALAASGPASSYVGMVDWNAGQLLDALSHPRP